MTNFVLIWVLYRYGNMQIRKQQSGQIIVEYLLVMVVAIAIATILTSRMIGRSDNPGFVLSAWSSLLQVIAEDNPDSVVIEE